MKILHYALGFPPERTGGLVQYSLDLIDEQLHHGDTVVLLYPGHVNPFTNKSYIKRDKKHEQKGCLVYKLVNSLPLALFGGIKQPQAFMASCNKTIYRNFLATVAPDVIHIHTLMGIHKEFFEVAKELKIRMILTSHDYFGLAPEPTFFYNGESYDECNTLHKWMQISENAMPIWKLKIFQTSFYPTIRRLLRKFDIGTHTKKKIRKSNGFRKKTNEKEFLYLRNYYLSIYKLIDIFHFNSQLAKEVYKSNLSIKIRYKVISITNSRIHHRTVKRKKHSPVRVAYVGPYKEYKGFFEFISLAESLKNKYDFYVFGSTEEIQIPRSIKNYGRFSSDEVRSVFESVDVIIVPSKWKETFGLITEEALSFGTAVFTSINVGSKDLIDKRFIFTDVNEISQLLLNINSYKITIQKTLNEHYHEINNLYRI